LEQVWKKYVDNSIKYTNSGTITMGYEYVDGGIKIFSKDTGIGIPQDKQARIFQRFEKVDMFSKGTGLGLAICKAIIIRFGGNVGFESEQDKGSTFWAWIPCKAEITQ
jgi:signal transduction histidine kinase